MLFGLDRSLLSGGEMQPMKQKQASKYAEESTNRFSLLGSLFFCHCLVLSYRLYISITHPLSLYFSCRLFHFISLSVRSHIPSLLSPSFSLSGASFLLPFSVSICLQRSYKLTCWRRSARCVGF